MENNNKISDRTCLRESNPRLQPPAVPCSAASSDYLFVEAGMRLSIVWFLSHNQIKMCLHTFPWGRRRRRRGVQLNGDTPEINRRIIIRNGQSSKQKQAGRKRENMWTAAGISDVIFGHFQELKCVSCNSG